MKLNIRKAMWIFALAVAVTAFVTPKLAGASQQDQSRDQANRNDNANNLMYQQGLNHGKIRPAVSHRFSKAVPFGSEDQMRPAKA